MENSKEVDYIYLFIICKRISASNEINMKLLVKNNSKASRLVEYFVFFSIKKAANHMIFVYLGSYRCAL